MPTIIIMMPTILVRFTTAAMVTIIIAIITVVVSTIVITLSLVRFTARHVVFLMISTAVRFRVVQMILIVFTVSLLVRISKKFRILFVTAISSWPFHCIIVMLFIIVRCSRFLILDVVVCLFLFISIGTSVFVCIVLLGVCTFRVLFVSSS